MASDEAVNKKQLARQTGEDALMDAALRLLERDGVLAGLNLQEVADEAGMNRALIHRYFGSRVALLRAALERRKERLAGAVKRSYGTGPDKRGDWAIRQYARDATYARVVMLLALDGDTEFEPIPYLEDRIEALRLETEDGQWVDDLDLVALTVLWDVILDGYFTMRKPLARQVKIAPKELDERVFALIGRVFLSLRGSSGSGS